ncbi:hypothetical protein DYB32_009155 [Aphanomyces invadans]|uniref:Peptidase A2 domain-containing protein n=1 Tax=Aphanomyces invadans TaxID=157072 RepID=A0A3R6YY58_9STRA|nr:hypothetical protein DYB32_009155 [Aphanomyces invadans]
MLDDLMRVLEQDHQEWVLHQEGKMVVEVMARAIRPDTLKSAVQKQLQLQRNKALKSDVFRFVNWLRQFSAGFQLYGDRGKGKDGGRGDGPKEGGGKNPPKIPLAAKPDVAGDKDDAAPKKGRGACLKCGDKDHRVAGCPKAAPGEAQRLLDAMVKNRQERVKVLADKSSRRSTNRGVMVEGVVRVENILLDTGADVNVVSRGVRDALAACDAAVDIVVHDITLDTTCGPLVLRGLKAWVDNTASSIDVIISRPVMEVLGFSVDDLLVEARQQKSEWDVSDGVDIPASNMARVSFLMAERRDPLDPCLEESDGMHCATPEVVGPKIIGASEESRRKTRNSAGRAYGQGG